MERNKTQHLWPGMVLALALLLVGLVTGCNPQVYEPPPTPTPGLPEIWLDWPVNGEYPPDPLEIIAHVNDPAGQGVDALEIRINGEPAVTKPLDRQPFFTKVSQPWPAEGRPEPGQYVVEVFAVRQGQYSEPDSAEITIVERRPEIEFTVDQPTINLSECVTLSWSVANAERIELRLATRSLADQARGGGDRIQGQYTDCPEQPANEYRLVAVPASGESEEQQVTVQVRATPKPPPQVEVSFEYDDTGYRAYGDCIDLEWIVSNAQRVQLDRIGSVEAVGLRGRREVCPTAPTNTYRLIVTSLTGEEFERRLTFRVPATPTPTPTSTSTPTPSATPTPTSTPVTPTITPTPTTPVPLPQADYWLRGNRTKITRGEQVILDWHTSGIISAYLEGGNLGRIGLVGDYGTEFDGPGRTTTYVLTVNLANGQSDTRTWKVEVDQPSGPPPEPIIEPPGNPQATHSDGVTTVRWNHSRGADYYKIVTEICELCPGKEFCVRWSSIKTFDRITSLKTRFSESSPNWCIDSRGPRGGSGVHACNDSGCTSGVPWSEPLGP